MYIPLEKGRDALLFVALLQTQVMRRARSMPRTHVQSSFFSDGRGLRIIVASTPHLPSELDALVVIYDAIVRASTTCLHASPPEVVERVAAPEGLGDRGDALPHLRAQRPAEPLQPPPVTRIARNVTGRGSTVVRKLSASGAGRSAITL